MKNILVVDIPSREALTVIYRIHNYDVIACSTGETALNICRRWKPELIVCGDMYDMHRTDFAANIALNARQLPLLVSIVRTWDDKVFRSCQAQALEWGFDICVRSPISLPTMLLWARVAELRDYHVGFFPREIK